MSKLDAYNSTLVGMPNFQIKKLQKIQNAAAKLVQAPKLDSITKIRKEFHWFPIGDLIKHYDIILSFYADNSQKYIHFNPDSNVDVKKAVSKMELCCAKVRNWMSSNQLKLNEGKTKVMIFGKPSDLKKLNITSICIRDSRIIPSLVATNIGVDRHSGLKLE